ncbi:hypothetical protein BDY24DRAFT_388619 [Mrakia frigida]|uniref:cyclin family protein n=1 Tax=Mrakia frigida TaxID=29902 RepID=UPI003FCC0394
MSSSSSSSTRTHSTRSSISSSSTTTSPSRSRGSSRTSSSSSTHVSSSSGSSSAPQQPPQPPAVAQAPPSDGWYGHQDISVAAAKFITSLFSCPNIPPATSPSSPQPPLANFIAYALHRTRLPALVTTSALLLLSRLKMRFPAARGSSGHRLFISAFMMASKVLCDDTYSNKSWCIVAQQMFALKEVNQMEREMLGYLEWNVTVSGEEIAGLDETLRTKFGPGPPVPPTPSTPSLVAPFPSIPSIHIAPSSAANAYPSPPTSPIALSTSASSESSPASSLGEPCTTPPDAAPGGYEAAKKVYDERHPVITKVVERAVGDEECDEEMEAVSSW